MTVEARIHRPKPTLKPRTVTPCRHGPRPAARARRYTARRPNALSRPLTETTHGRTLTSSYDLAGRRTRLDWPDGRFVTFVHDLADRLDQVREEGAATGPGVLINTAYDDLGRRVGVNHGNGATTRWVYAANSRNWTQTLNLAGTGFDLTTALTLNPAGQIVSRALSNDAYAYAPPVRDQAYARDGLNRYTAVAGTAFAHDGRGNLTDDGPYAYGYDVKNRLTSVTGGSTVTFTHDPLGRLSRSVLGSTDVRFLYDGDRLVAEYDAAGAVTARYVHGAGPDEPVVRYPGPTLGARTWLHADHQGSIVAVSDGAGAIVGSPYSYSPYGEPDAVSGFGGSRFRYTGQISLRHVSLWHYKARTYQPRIGRFLQTDPVGYEDGLNLYRYVGNDPVNNTDPTGMCPRCIVSVYRIGKRVVQTRGNLSRAIREEGASFVENAATLLDGQLTSADAFSVIDLATGFGGEARGATEVAGRALGRRAPSANDGVSRPHGAPDHNRAIDDRVREVRGEGATDIRKNQTQVDAQGNRVGNNRPDLGYTDRTGTRHSEEWGRNRGRVEGQVDRARQNDSGCVTTETCLPR